MSGILRLESLTKGNTLKQGDKTPLKYRLFDADGEKLNIAGKSASARLVYPDFLTIGYEKGGLTVAQDDTVTFTIDNVIPPRMYHIEIIVDDKFVFPSRADESKFTVDKSSLGADTNIIEIVGKDVLIREVKSQVDTELQPLVTSLESAQQAELERVQAENERSEKFESEIYTIRNLVKNGNFEDSNNWDSASGVVIADGMATFSADGSAQFLTQSGLWEANLNTGHDIFISFEVLENTLVGNGAFGVNNVGADDFSSGEYIDASVGTHTLVHKVRSGVGRDNRIAFWITNRFTSGSIKIKNIIVIDLTETFGNNQPNSSYLENLIKENSGYFAYLSSSDVLKNELVKLSQNWGTSHGEITPVEGESFDFNKVSIDGYGYGYSIRRNIVNAPEGRNVNNAFYYWSYLHESGSNKYINQFYIDAMTGEMWLRNSRINSAGVLTTLSGWVKIGGDEREVKYQKIQGIGDSIMYGLPDTGTGRLTNPWISQIASYFKSDVINLGINSSTIATNKAGDNPVFSNGNRNPIVERLDALDTSADLTILEGGINDFWIGIPLGNFDSRDTDTFYGALHAYYGGVAEMLHDKQVVVMTCLQSTTSNPNGVSLYDWTRAQVEVANHYSLPVFDAYSEAGIAPRVSSQKTKYMNDGLHLSQAGADRLSERFVGYL